MRQTPNRDRSFVFPLAGKEMGYVYFLGIGGIGMSALARYLNTAGYAVCGYDKSESDITRGLQTDGISVHYTDEVSSIPAGVQLVVYTPAVPTDLSIYQHCIQLGVPMKKRSEVLQSLTEKTFNVCVAGTHGKTTTSTLIAHILRHSEYGCQAYLGGISVNYQTNTWSSDRNVSVIEADEYDRSFLRLHPDLAVITAMDPDHLDIYGTAEAMEEAYIEFTGLLSDGGKLIYHHSLKRAQELHGNDRSSYSLLDTAADYHARALAVEAGGYRFDLQTPQGVIADCRLPIGGLHNVENAIAAAAASQSIGIDPDSIRMALSCFKGVKRRFETVYRNSDKIWIDDYAHHPEELRALLQSVRDLYPDHYVRLVFQPHLFTRTRDLAAAFGETMSLADESLLLPIYPARELPIEGVRSEMICSKQHPTGFSVYSKESFMEWMVQQCAPEGKGPTVIVTAGAGDIDQLYPIILNRLKHP
jgi:UDP-N-acetylmuramate--alanine ligase